jgi:hypothetical protein
MNFIPNKMPENIEHRKGGRPGYHLVKVWVLAALAAFSCFAAPAQQTNRPALRDFSSFQMIGEGNIFNPNRRPRFRPARTPRPVVESFSLVGTMSYDANVLAFFDGTGSPNYNKVVKAGVPNSIAGFQVSEIGPSSVKLRTPTNEFELKVGMQMRRGDDGKWTLGLASESLGNAYAGNRNRRDSRRGDFNPMNSQMAYAPSSGTNDLQPPADDASLADMGADAGIDNMAADAGGTNGPPDLSGETDPVVLRLMQQRLNQAPPPPPENN